MAYNEELGRRVAVLLTVIGVSFTEKKMFGGLGFMINGKMSVGIVKDDLMLRVLDDDYENVLEMPNVRPMDFTGRPMKGFVYVAPEGFAEDASLRKWLAYGIEFGKYGAVKSKAKKQSGGEL